MEEKKFTEWDVFVIGLNMFVLGMLLFRTTGGSGGSGGSLGFFKELSTVLFKISTWFMVLWMIGLVGMATYTYLKNHKSGMTVAQSFTKMTWLYLLLEIPMGLCYYWAINVI